MVDDIRLVIGWPSHWKTRALRRACGDRAPLCLIELWMYAAQHKPDGNLGGMTDDEIEAAAGWEGERGAFAGSLRSPCRYLDEGNVLHQWDDHQRYVVTAPLRKAQASAAAAARYAKVTEQPWRQRKAAKPAVATAAPQASTSRAEPERVGAIVNGKPISWRQRQTIVNLCRGDKHLADRLFFRARDAKSPYGWIIEGLKAPDRYAMTAAPEEDTDKPAVERWIAETFGGKGKAASYAESSRVGETIEWIVGRAAR